MNFDAIFKEMELLGYTDVRYSLFKGHIRGTTPDGEVHYYIAIEGGVLERINS